FVLHSCGILGSYIAMSFEKFLVDEEACGFVRAMLKPLDITDESIDLDCIKEVGIGGQYLTHPKTFQLCRTEFHMPTLYSRQNPDSWTKAGKKSIDEIAEDKVAQRLATYEKPEIDPAIEKELTDYVEKRKNA
ncbi:MAG: trimethylamine methyltransferase family protein, partial [Desulfobacterales bacterium]|nr:trimethylamine methyltransferase family protein [Desulfobacterales bacterium]